ncbi:MAG TPA: DUF1501 domain-containing protein [Vicinamibacteria bacterium]|nr:DUF1501 domain-containing protein [Vicinamibacteria bacterium]
MSNRREFLRACAGVSATAMAASMSRLGIIDAFAHDHADWHKGGYDVATDYRAMVCIFLEGGNDSWNTIVNISDYNSYAAIRQGLAVAQNQLLGGMVPPSDGRTFGLHPALAAIRPFWDSGKLAVVANVGSLFTPLDRTTYLARPDLRPPSLFSHSDQVAQWNTSCASPALLTGWGGRVGDRTIHLNGDIPFPMMVSISGATLFGTGVVVRPLEVTSGGTVGLQGFNTSAISQTRYNAMKQLLSTDNNVTFAKTTGNTTGRAIETNELLSAALTTIPPPATVFPNTGLGNQLRMVARIINARQLLNIHREIFFVRIGGFDTHSGQITNQPNLLTQVAQAMAAFYNATVEMGIPESVVQFTASDFSRTLRFNGGGTDHAWGSCQFVLGGAVRGREMYGDWPTFALGGPDDSGNQGRFIPTTAVDQYTATLAQWYGLAPGDVNAVFPNINRFNSNNLGFLA